MKIQIIIQLFLTVVFSQEIYTNYLVENNDTLDVFSYQIPENYNDNNQHPLLITFHQWGGNQNSNYYTNYDEEANERNWILLSPFGGSSNNYNHQGMQSMVEKEIEWMIENFKINKNKIYAVGGSMGGAAGAIYANNHLDPTKPMIAATASASGILDCERRAIEMDGNNSMIEWFGGNWNEVPFEYHRNSAVYFSDSTQSMHFNLKYTPLYLDFGITEPHRTHAEELYNLLQSYNHNMWIDSLPQGTHGYSVIDENHSCDWMDQFELIDDPDNINVNLDQPSRAYWLEAKNIIESNSFIKINSIRNNNNYTINQFLNSDTLIIHTFKDSIINSIQINNSTNSNFEIGISGNQEIMRAISDYNLNFNNQNTNNDLESFENTIYFNIANNGFHTIDFNFYQDVNFDNIFNILDIISIVNHIINNEILLGISFSNADLDQNGILDILDIIMLVYLITNE